MKSDSTTYIINRIDNTEPELDSAYYRNMLVIEKDTSLFFSFDDLALQQAATLQTIQEKSHTGIKKPFSLEQDDGIFALLLICFLFFTRIYKGSFSFFKENVRLLFSNKDNVRTFSETTVTEFWFNFILIFQTILLSSIIIFDVFLESDNYSLPQHSLITIILFMSTLTVFGVLKYLFYRMIGYLFNVKNRIHLWLRYYLFVFEIVGVIAFIPTLVLVYSQNYHSFLIIFFTALFVISHLILFYKLIIFFLQENVNLLFLIAYLCSVEIIPYIILSEVLVFIYKIDITNFLWL